MCVECSCFQYLMHKDLKWLKLLEMICRPLIITSLFCYRIEINMKAIFLLRIPFWSIKEKNKLISSWNWFFFCLLSNAILISGHSSLASKDCQHFRINFGWQHQNMKNKISLKNYKCQWMKFVFCVVYFLIFRIIRIFRNHLNVVSVMLNHIVR